MPFIVRGTPAEVKASSPGKPGSSSDSEESDAFTSQRNRGCGGAVSVARAGAVLGVVGQSENDIVLDPTIVNSDVEGILADNGETEANLERIKSVTSTLIPGMGHGMMGTLLFPDVQPFDVNAAPPPPYLETPISPTDVKKIMAQLCAAAAQGHPTADVGAVPVVPGPRQPPMIGIVPAVPSGALKNTSQHGIDPEMAADVPEPELGPAVDVWRSAFTTTPTDPDARARFLITKAAHSISNFAYDTRGDEWSDGKQRTVHTPAYASLAQVSLKFNLNEEQHRAFVLFLMPLIDIFIGGNAGIARPSRT
ncbi:hypothetical protein H9P43_002916 [Blastocladiella emersonii ATCC 22665]|nr:hypothetical protein H9P43_006167 [Blastocladiella emersonii ATCC 22665]KAI9183864.1 hypothetical protein H9P43_002916 [Blastocladiella emersonii ATCC 22665]